MDRVIKRFAAEQDGDLMLCCERGVAYSRDMTITAQYDDNYFAKCAGYEGQDISCKINAGRIALVNKYVGDDKVLDIGVGSGEFIKTRGENTFGYDINPQAINWLKKAGRWRDDFRPFSSFTFWDVLEHVEEPELYLRHVPPGGCLFTCLPIFDDLARIRESKHYRPGEHLYYWTQQGFVEWIAQYAFDLLEMQTFETDAGRDSILSFAFRRTLPRYHDTIAQYREMHSKFYGASAYLYFDAIAREVLSLDPKSILDFGCGRSDMVAHFWADGRRRIARYDPAISAHKTMPEGAFDLVLCCDVMEHIRLEDVDRVLNEIKSKSSRVIFTISMRPARAKLPDGRNAHVTLLSADEWMRWIGSVFGKARRIPTEWDHILMLKTFAK